MAEPRLQLYACRRVADEVPGAVSLPCAGRLAAGTLVEAFAEGAAGVAVVPCGEARHGCRFRTGAERAEHAVERARRVLGRLGLAAERLAVLPSPSLLGGFREFVASLGPTGVPSGRSFVDADGIDRWMEAVTALSVDRALTPRRRGGRPNLVVPGTPAPVVLWEGCVSFAQLLLDEALGGAGEGEPVRLLSSVGVQARILPDERCCGALLLASGRKDEFRAVATLNAARLRETGASRVIVRCASCAQALARDYADAGAQLEAEVVLLADALAEAGWRPAQKPAARVADCSAAGEQAAARLLEGVPVLPGGPLHGVTGWLAGATARKGADKLFVGLARRKADTVLASCPRCALALRVIGRPGSWRPRTLRVLGLGDLLPGRAEVER
jgi:hypothetical protein